MSEPGKEQRDIEIPDEFVNDGRGWHYDSDGRTRDIVEKVYAYLSGNPEIRWKIKMVFDDEKQCILVLLDPADREYVLIAEVYDRKFETIEGRFESRRGDLISERCHIFIDTKDRHDSIHFTSPNDENYIRWIIGWLETQFPTDSELNGKDLKAVGEHVYCLLEKAGSPWTILGKKLYEVPGIFDEDKDEDKLELAYEAQIKNGREEEYLASIILREHWFDEYGKKRAIKCDLSFNKGEISDKDRVYVRFDSTDSGRAVAWALNWLNNY